MKNITLVATDLDGTLLNSEKKVSEVNREAIKKLKNHGIMFGIASGRPVETVRAMIKDWGIEDSVSFLMGMNGGAFYDIRQRTKEDYNLMSGKVILEIIKFFEDMDVVFQVLVGEIRFTNKSTEKTRAQAKLFGETEIEVNLNEFLPNRMVNKLIIHCDPSYMNQVVERASNFRHKDCVGFLTANDLFEYVDPVINKGFGIKKVCKHFGCSMDHVVAFGDAANDIEMLSGVGCGVCMKNGTSDVKAVANVVSEYTNDEDAIAHFINDVILKDKG